MTKILEREDKTQLLANSISAAEHAINIGNYNAAMEHAQNALAHCNETSQHEVFDLVGRILFLLKNYQDAEICFRKALENKDFFEPSLINLALCLIEQKKYEQAIEFLKKICDNYYNTKDIFIAKTVALLEEISCHLPYNIQAPYLVALTLAKMDYNSCLKALEYCKKVHEIDRKDINNNLLMADIYLHFLDYDEALAICDVIIKNNPDNINGYEKKSDVLYRVNRIDESIKTLESALSIAPTNAVLIRKMGYRKLTAGEKIKGVKLLWDACLLDPDYAAAYISYASAEKFSVNSEKTSKILGTIDDFLMKPDDKVSRRLKNHLKFVKTKIYNDIREYDKSFIVLDAANKERFQAISSFGNMTPEKDIINLTGWICNNVTKVKLDEIKNPNKQEKHLIFIVGMPRSGTSLTERVLGGHSKITAAGELPNIAVFDKKIRHKLQITEHIIPEYLFRLQKEDAPVFAEEYTDKLVNDFCDFTYLTDKMPFNLEYLGLIAILFPSAKIVICQRHPLDIFISCYFQNFTHGNFFAFDSNALIATIKAYKKLQQHFAAVLPNPVLLSYYEELVTNQEQASRKLIEFCGLDWQDSCLDTHKAKNLTKTASIVQVQDKIYTSSINRWKHFKKHIKPVVEELKNETMEYEHSLKTLGVNYD